ncbi:hypothetical protein E2C01_006278 [Portunus trituberculatus]|uniref:Uncharacterized protein n=1 Tax=Portunus trituberculatus TaxID=210409 RepID=A0A5B7CVX6_PORTR|nr:hypothetical protein [Portunus trituberculatus]
MVIMAILPHRTSSSEKHTEEKNNRASANLPLARFSSTPSPPTQSTGKHSPHSASISLTLSHNDPADSLAAPLLRNKTQDKTLSVTRRDNSQRARSSKDRHSSGGKQHETSAALKRSKTVDL